VTLVASAFAGRPQLERHRMVYSAVAPLMGHGIHALSIVAHAPNES
jgi:BolA protein